MCLCQLWLCNKCHRLGCLNNWHLFSHSSEGWKSKIKVPAGLVSGEVFSWLAYGHLLSVFSRGLYSAQVERKGEICLVPFSLKSISPMGSEPCFFKVFFEKNIKYLTNFYIDCMLKCFGHSKLNTLLQLILLVSFCFLKYDY